MKAAIKILFLLLLLPLHGRLLSQFTQDDMAGDLDEALTFRSYPTYDHYLQIMQGFATEHPGLCRLDTFGTTPGGRLLLALKISDNPQAEEAEAPFFYTSTMHGDEIPGYVLLLRMADTLLRGYGTDPEIRKVVDGLEIWINPLANPDGAYASGNHTLAGATRENAPTMDYPIGRDLNRDFPDPARGEVDDSGGRAPETVAMMEFLRDKAFVLSANIHSGKEVVNYPWDHRSEQHVDSTWFRFISGEYADEAMAVDPTYMFGWPEGGITNGYQWYPTQGSRQDYVCFYLGGREVTLELYKDKILPSEKLEWIWEVNYRSLLNYMSQCLYGIRGRVVDAQNQTALEAQVKVLNHDSAWTVVYSRADQGDYYRLLSEGSYDLVFSSATGGYIPDTIRQVEVSSYQATMLDVSLTARPEAVPALIPGTTEIWPNPAHERLYIRSGDPLPAFIRLELCTIDGKVLMKKDIRHPAREFSIALPAESRGLYFLRLLSPEQVQCFPLFIH